MTMPKLTSWALHVSPLFIFLYLLFLSPLFLSFMCQYTCRQCPLLFLFILNMQFAEMCLAHELVRDKSKEEMDHQQLFKRTKKDISVTCHIAISQLLILKKEYETAKQHLLEVVKEENEVSNIYHFQISHNFKKLLYSIVQSDIRTWDRTAFFAPMCCWSVL